MEDVAHAVLRLRPLPKDSGYRAIHVVVEQGGCLVGIQMRTRRMHSWAELVESLSAVLEESCEQDDGAAPVRDFTRLLARLYVARWTEVNRSTPTPRRRRTDHRHVHEFQRFAGARRLSTAGTHAHEPGSCLPGAWSTRLSPVGMGSYPRASAPCVTRVAPSFRLVPGLPAVPPVGLEPTTFGLKVRSSDQLS